ncbi:MAG: DNA mismatch repair endonuclease MutL [Treponema sp.]|jgi:DNA mismatch repair protein MutL|nr:DNA mismatch repair endonuclease MutL [Treponema sp.]
MALIQILPPEEAKKIAAGEVIDRPAALVREFMDNALDAGATLVEVSVDGGGMIRTEVTDDGEGMAKEDMELCCLTHATSKIRSMSDLDSAETLGFRGEALAAAAAVSRLEIISSRDGIEAWKLETGPGKDISLERSRRTRGTSVRALGLFDSIPARKRFLKREGSEAAACRNIFNEKALAFPDRSFRFMQDGRLKVFLPPESSYKNRFGKIVLDSLEKESLHEITANGQGFQAVIVFGGPSISRPDKRQQYVFTNGRRIQDYSLLQALEYGLRGWFPNGTHPVGTVYISIDPVLADFNIHPAKREVRFADPGAIHHSITSALENFRRMAFSYKDEEKPEKNSEFFNEYIQQPAQIPVTGNFTTEKLAAVALTLGENEPLYQPTTAPLLMKNGVRLLGRLFELFILVEYEGRLFIIDQHAAHERILYDQFISASIPKQELLVAIPLATENEADDRFLKDQKNKLADLGITIEEDEGGWRIEALPAGWRLSDSETIREILSLRTAGRNMAEHWAATLSCKRAVKDGDFLDDESALDLAERTLRLPDPRCPHGRPIWMEIRREEILRAVKRM